MAGTSKNPGHFSRRHLTSAAHEEAHARYLADDAAKRADVAERIALRKARTPAEQLALLDERLGEGLGAARECARLQTRINQSKK